jgi:hypothetical protein
MLIIWLTYDGGHDASEGFEALSIKDVASLRGDEHATVATLSEAEEEPHVKVASLFDADGIEVFDDFRRQLQKRIAGRQTEEGFVRNIRTFKFHDVC